MMPSDELPRIGLGTWKLTGSEGIRTMTTALEMGYRHLDTAQMYENEAAVGEAIAASDVPREDVFVATKINHRNLPAASHEEVLSATQESLDRLGVETLDLLSLHWPVGDYDPAETLGAFDTLVDDGTIRHVGVCNCTPDLLVEAIDHLDAPLFAHQVEVHPLLAQEELHGLAREHDHHLVAYSPLAHGRVLDIPELVEISQKHDVSPAQVSLAWILSRENAAAVPKASSDAHLRQNLEAAARELDPEDIERIEAIDRVERVVNPETAPWNR